MVYGLFALFFDVLIIPFLRDSTSLEDTVIFDASEMSLWTYLIVGMLSSSERATFSQSTRIFLVGSAMLCMDTGRVARRRAVSAFGVVSYGRDQVPK